MSKLSIPEISSEELEARYSRLKPVVKDEQGKLHWIKRPDSLSHIAFTWDPKLEEEATGLKPIKTITTLHTYGYYGMFKPSIKEVLAQVPSKLLNEAVAFHVQGPETAQDLNKFKKELNDGFHVAFTTFYQKSDEDHSSSSVFRRILKRLRLS